MITRRPKMSHVCLRALPVISTLTTAQEEKKRKKNSKVGAPSSKFLTAARSGNHSLSRTTTQHCGQTVDWQLELPVDSVLSAGPCMYYVHRQVLAQ